MLFRRVKAHIEKENWFAVFIDFLIVVVGVFIGIQVANWNAALGDKSLANEYIQRLTADFEDIDSRLKDNIVNFEESIEFIQLINQMITQAEKPTGKRDVEFKQALLNSFSSSIPGWQSASYLEMQSAGDTSLLKSTELKMALIEYDQTTEISHKGWEVLMNQTQPVVEGLDGFIMYASLKEATDGRRAYEIVKYNYDDMLKSKAFEVYMSSLTRIQSNNLTLQKNQRDKAQAVLNLLKGTKGK